MTRVKRGTIAIKRRRNVLGQAKGFRFGRRNKEKLAIEALKHAGRNAYRDRRAKKREFRRLWQIKINGAVRPLGMSYSSFIGKMTAANVQLDRKVLADVAENHPESFKQIVEMVKNTTPKKKEAAKEKVAA